VPVVEAAIAAGATTINLPDTVGYALPVEYATMFRAVRERVPGADRVVLSAHCHDDLGLAVANSLAAIEAGAGQVECTVNGIGERAGNAALEEIVVAGRVRPQRGRVQLRCEPPGAVPDQPALVPCDRRVSPAQQSGSRPQRLRPRSGDPSARRAAERAHVRDHPPGRGGGCVQHE